VLRSQGRPLEPAVRAEMETRFGYEFGRVRVHTDAAAAESARALGARAYTVGRDVAFAAGRYEPHMSEGQRLLAHELTHVVQQDAPGAPTSGPGGVETEMEARRLGALAAVGARVVPRARTPLGLAMQSDPETTISFPGVPFSTAVAEREPEAPSDGVFFNGVVLMIRRRRDTLMQVRAYSGFESPAQYEKQGPIPDGNFFMQPSLVRAPIEKRQEGGQGGARGIDSGYQKIYARDVQDAWGEERIAIEPSAKCVPLPPGTPPPPGMKQCGLPDGTPGVFRAGFYIHRGKGTTTSGCIKVPDDDGPGQSALAHRVFDQLRSMGTTVRLVVRKTARRPRS
jgi:Domain of unknown function (DUF4157)